MSELSGQIRTESTGSGMDVLAANFILFGLVILIAGMVALLTAQVPSIAHGLLSGGASGSGFKGLGAITQSLGGKALGGGIGAAYNNTAGKMVASRQGARDAAAGLSPQGKFNSRSQRVAYAKSHKSNRPEKPAP
jgi:hypothetical protein